MNRKRSAPGKPGATGGARTTGRKPPSRAAETHHESSRGAPRKAASGRSQKPDPRPQRGDSRVPASSQPGGSKPGGSKPGSRPQGSARRSGARPHGAAQERTAGSARPRPGKAVAPTLAAPQQPSAPREPIQHAARLVEVSPDRDGQRIDNFLLGQLKGVPRTLVYRLLRTGQVRIDGRRCKAEVRVQTGQQVRIPPLREASAGAPLQASDSLLAGLEQRIVAEDGLVLVLDKPSGLASHGGSGLAFGVIEALRQARPQASLELVHRLDRDTSGLLVLAKKRSALLELQRQLREGGGDKRYLALLVGSIERDRIDVNAPLRKQVLAGGERMVRVSSDGKPSLSHFRVLERLPGCTLVEVRIETGRTHQIRVHAAHLGHPVAGDDKYGDSDANRRLRAFGLERLFLHAAELRLQQPGGGEWHWRAPLPDSLQAVLARLRQTA